MERASQISRKTNETDITVKLDLGGGDIRIDTGIGFFDHMLSSFASHAGFGLDVKASGDLKVDCHHTVEDTGIVLGKAFKQAIGDKAGINRFASAYIPMDEALAFCAADVSGRPYLVFDADMNEQKIGDYDSCLTVEFMRAFAMNAEITLHLRCEYGKNAHHITEALFKAFARSLKSAVRIRGGKIPSTKGVL
ncbi:MAG: imidazoleglycerol-phosphate dehydratase HisB [Clostridiales bacterium]|nr:imidazoleglycerol-phosphate dehydratase HisB [Clostridiales bacterium]